MNYIPKVRWFGRKTVFGEWTSQRYNVNKLYYIHSGSCYFNIGEHREYLKEGYLYLIPASSEIIPISESECPLDHSYVDFELVPPFLGNGLYELSPSIDPLVRAAADVMIGATEKSDTGYYFNEVSKSTAELVLAAVLFLVDKISDIYGVKSAEYDEIAMSVMADISENIQNGITVSALAEKYFMTEESIIRKFKRAFGITPIAYLRRLRLSTAAYLLGEGKRLSDVAHEVGYADSSALLHAMGKDRIKSNKKLKK